MLLLWRSSNIVVLRVLAMFLVICFWPRRNESMDVCVYCVGIGSKLGLIIVEVETSVRV